MRYGARLMSFVATVLLVPLAIAQDDGAESEQAAMSQTTITLEVAESGAYGPHLVDEGGRAVYLFVDDDAGGEWDAAQYTRDVRDSAGECPSACQETWPPVVADAAEAGDGIDEGLVYTAEADVPTQLVVNGWPLYYFEGDDPPQQEARAGQGEASFGGVWYLVSPEGEPIETRVEDVDPESQNGDGDGGGS